MEPITLISGYAVALTGVYIYDRVKLSRKIAQRDASYGMLWDRFAETAAKLAVIPGATPKISIAVEEVPGTLPPRTSPELTKLKTPSVSKIKSESLKGILDLVNRGPYYFEEVDPANLANLLRAEFGSKMFVLKFSSREVADAFINTYVSTPTGSIGYKRILEKGIIHSRTVGRVVVPFKFLPTVEGE